MREQDISDIKRIFKTGTKEEIKTALLGYFKKYQGENIKPSKYDFMVDELDGKLPIIS